MRLINKFKNIFGKSEKNEAENENYGFNEETRSEISETVVNVLREEKVLSEPLDFSKAPDEVEIKAYIDANIEKMAVFTRENAELRKEYEKVTKYLIDIQTIDGMEPQRKESLIKLALEIVGMEKEQKKNQKIESRLTNRQYKTMQQYEETMNADLVNLKKKEKYQMDIKSDFRYLEAEKKLLFEERKEVRGRTRYFKSMSVCFSVMIVSLLIFIFIMAAYSEYDMTIPFIICGGAAAGVILYTFQGIVKNKKSLIVTNRKLMKAVNMLNSVKIKYINNTALLDYIYEKFSVKSSAELEYVWSQYLRVKDWEEKNTEFGEKIKENKEKLIEMLKEEGVNDTNVWTSQVIALVECKEMVEVRHKLNVRRGKLREQIAYNDDKYDACSELLGLIIKDKPQYENMIKKSAKQAGLSDIML